MNRRSFLVASAMAIATPAQAMAPVVIGLLLPLSGPDAALGQSMREAALLAVDDCNRTTRGLRPAIVPVVEDSGADPRRFLARLTHLLSEKKIVSVFGLCPPAARGPMMALLQQSENLFWDCGPSEGGECSKHVIHGGPTPHQSLAQLLPWLVEQAGARLFLVGTDQPRPAELLRVARMMAGEIGANVVGPAELLPPGHTDFAATVARVQSSHVDVVISTLLDSSAVAFLRQYRAAGIDPLDIPVASPTLSAAIVAANPAAALGAIACAPYFTEWLSPANALFLQRLRQHGSTTSPGGETEAAWFLIKLFAAALDNLGGGDIAPLNLREAAKNCTVDAPQGQVRIEADTLYATQWPKIAVVETGGRFKILARSDEALHPLPFWAFGNKSCSDGGIIGS